MLPEQGCADVDDFVPCVDGLSHNEAEHIHPNWAEAGANVLLLSMLDKAAD